jgi:hypothetical protein
MRLWLVNHSYGAALIHAESAAEAEELGGRLGDVSRVVAYGGALALTLREPVSDLLTEEGEPDIRLRVDAAAEVPYAEDLRDALRRHRMTAGSYVSED